MVLATGGLSYELTLVISRPYMIAKNIDVPNGLANRGARGFVALIEYQIDTEADDYNIDEENSKNIDDGKVKRLWLRFPEK